MSRNTVSLEDVVSTVVIGLVVIVVIPFLIMFGLLMSPIWLVRQIKILRFFEERTGRWISYRELAEGTQISDRAMSSMLVAMVGAEILRARLNDDELRTCPDGKTVGRARKAEVPSRYTYAYWDYRLVHEGGRRERAWRLVKSQTKMAFG